MAVLSNMLIGFKQILVSPFNDFSTWWFLVPLLILWITLEVYFGKYKSEKLGWNTALGNGISMIWINVESMRYLFSLPERPDLFWIRFLFIFLILAYAGFVVYISFTHRFSSKVTYSLASPTSIYYLSAISVLWGHGNLVLTRWVILDLILLFPIVLGFFVLLRKLLPESEKDVGGGEGGLGGEEALGGEGLGPDAGLGSEESSDFGDIKL